MVLSLSKNELDKLIAKAREGLSHSYAPYSGFHVGAAVQTVEGQIFTGCNIENASYGDTVCAERTAIFKAVSEGYRDLTDIVIVCSDDTFPFPCGMCLQVMSEFMPKGRVHVVNGGEVRSFTVAEMLPYAFRLD